MMRRRMGRPGLIGAAARTAVVTGTATAVNRRVQARADERDAERYAPAEPAPAAPAPAPAESSQESRVDQLKTLADLKTQGVLSDEEFAAEKARILNG
ncbi:SHOCT domain-containing protein [Streptomyces sp. NPDC021020]|uniref:SHOCT domain-containing protein n=1 Tax=Streptomyces sp. NPDC021020 TaxID=3365109 RepID=UPI003787D8B3